MTTRGITMRVEAYVHRDATGVAVAMCPSPQEGRKPERGWIVYLDGSKQRWEFDDPAIGRKLRRGSR
jgi:hypothetical protein